MAEYIERDAFIAWIEKQKRLSKLLTIMMLQETPAADVVEVVHSRWKYFRKQGIAVCMNCSFERNLDDNFGRAISCPNCGAKMDGDVA